MRCPIGIMQGRLSTPSSRGPQVFPLAHWRQEFDTAKELGFDTIEWLVESESFGANPLLSAAGRAELAKVASVTGVKVASVCAHSVLQWRPFDGDGTHRMEAFPDLIMAAGIAGVERVIVPILEDATITKAASPAQAAEMFRPATRAAERAGVDLAFEMDRPAIECRAFIELLASPRARLCYDSGNATAKGCDIVKEISQLLPIIAEIHLKDRLVGGASQALGRGDTRFAEFFQTLKKSNWAGPFVLETPTGSDAREQARQNLAFVKNFLS